MITNQPLSLKIALPEAADVIAPDGSEVRLLSRIGAGSMAHFTLLANQVSRAVEHRTVEELWYFLHGQGQMWRSHGQHTTIDVVGTGDSISIPVATQFQFRNTGEEPLVAVAVTMPPWPDDDEAALVDGPWVAQV